ncbi:MAG: flagellar biosynthetic protein FliR [Heliobacteriaceae bacterium]|nr:flagellar biosynthetic protein FliR [Heliobacteriaceae bacterium]MDD4587221.1 flagellar biosynthetic protein FliR [Heliobacteriaceae bacterium]
MDTIVAGLMGHIEVYCLVVARVGGLIATAPVFNNRAFPALAKLGLSLFVAVLLVGVWPENTLPPPTDNLLAFTVTICQEALVGIGIGFILQLVFAAILTAGQMIDYQIGFGIVNVLDPMWGSQVPMTGLFLQLMALLFFVVFDGHLLLLQLLAESFQMIPVGVWAFQTTVAGDLAAYMVRLFAGMFMTAVHLAMPVIGLILVSDIALGIVARTVPQLNIFVVGIPVKIIVGIAFLWAVLPFYIAGLNQLFALSFSDATNFLRLLTK